VQKTDKKKLLRRKKEGGGGRGDWGEKWLNNFERKRKRGFRGFVLKDLDTLGGTEEGGAKEREKRNWKKRGER